MIIMDIYRMIARLDRVQTFRSHTKKKIEASLPNTQNNHTKQDQSHLKTTNKYKYEIFAGFN